ncbi:MAG TPA: mechanosensitive ion channel domain-containing protein [Gemmatimonadales bacterium]|nr:mechanosensitive ion channel domain-containing protein [Gemmatimonadales bacterium]
MFTVISIYPYLPGSETAAFRGISIFLGVLVSFSSASAVGNIIAGVVMTYMRPFQVGDRVKIADTVGDVVRKTLLVTRVRTTKNVEVTIPNSMVLSSHIIDFSSAVAQASVEIMSPHYSALRDGNQTTVPAEYLSKSYRPPAFRLLQTDQVAEPRSGAT